MVEIIPDPGQALPAIDEQAEAEYAQQLNDAVIEELNEFFDVALDLANSVDDRSEQIGILTYMAEQSAATLLAHAIPPQSDHLAIEVFLKNFVETLVRIREVNEQTSSLEGMSVYEVAEMILEPEEEDEVDA